MDKTPADRKRLLDRLRAKKEKMQKFILWFFIFVWAFCIKATIGYDLTGVTYKGESTGSYLGEPIIPRRGVRRGKKKGIWRDAAEIILVSV